MQYGDLLGNAYIIQPPKNVEIDPLELQMGRALGNGAAAYNPYAQQKAEIESYKNNLLTPEYGLQVEGDTDWYYQKIAELNSVIKGYAAQGVDITKPNMNPTINRAHLAYRKAMGDVFRVANERKEGQKNLTAGLEKGTPVYYGEGYDSVPDPTNVNLGYIAKDFGQKYINQYQENIGKFASSVDVGTDRDTLNKLRDDIYGNTRKAIDNEIYQYEAENSNIINYGNNTKSARAAVALNRERIKELTRIKQQIEQTHTSMNVQKSTNIYNKFNYGGGDKTISAEEPVDVFRNIWSDINKYTDIVDGKPYMPLNVSFGKNKMNGISVDVTKDGDIKGTAHITIDGKPELREFRNYLEFQKIYLDQNFGGNTISNEDVAKYLGEENMRKIRPERFMLNQNKDIILKMIKEAKNVGSIKGVLESMPNDIEDESSTTRIYIPDEFKIKDRKGKDLEFEKASLYFVTEGNSMYDSGIAKNDGGHYVLKSNSLTYKFPKNQIGDIVAKIKSLQHTVTGNDGNTTSYNPVDTNSGGVFNNSEESK